MARGLDTKGLKPQLISRLKEALEAEKAQDGVESLNESKENTTNADDSTQNSINLSLNADDDQMQIDIVLAKNEENLAEEPITEHKPDLLPHRLFHWSSQSLSSQNKRKNGFISCLQTLTS